MGLPGIRFLCLLSKRYSNSITFKTFIVFNITLNHLWCSQVNDIHLNFSMLSQYVERFSWSIDSGCKKNTGLNFLSLDLKFTGLYLSVYHNWVLEKVMNLNGRDLQYFLLILILQKMTWRKCKREIEYCCQYLTLSKFTSKNEVKCSYMNECLIDKFREGIIKRSIMKTVKLSFVCQGRINVSRKWRELAGYLPVVLSRSGNEN